MLERTISLIGTLKRVSLCHSKECGRNVYYILESLSKKDEDNIEELVVNKRHVYYKSSSGDIIDEKDILLYGSIDLKDENDISEIKRLKLVDQDDGNLVYSNFNYDSGTVKTVEGRLKHHDTFDPILNFKQKHCRIGKPDRVIIYKHYGKKHRK